MSKKKTNQSGFTLVELAIVLVIIGLIVGGVLVGQDLINAATMRKAITQVRVTEEAATTFRTKYNALPGDLRNAASFFAAVTGATNANGQGDGDGLVEGISAAGTPCTTAACASGETAVFYYESAQAGYIKESITNVDMASVTATVAVMNTMFVPSVLGRGAILVPTSSAATNLNYLVLAGAPSAAAAAGAPTYTNAVTPLQASDIDTKLDDGDPTRGGVISIATATAFPSTAAAGANGANLCYAGTLYNATITTLNCNLSIRVSF